MTKNWAIVEKGSAIFLVLWGLAALIVQFWQLSYFYEFGMKYTGMTWADISIPKLLLNHGLPFLYALITLFAGTTLLFGKRLGWLVSVAATCSATINFVRLLLGLSLIEESAPDFSRTLFAIPAVIFATICVLLLWPPIREKYAPTVATWWAIIVLLVLEVASMVVFSPL